LLFVHVIAILCIVLFSHFGYYSSKRLLAVDNMSFERSQPRNSLFGYVKSLLL